MVEERTDSDADTAVTELYMTHYVRLVRLAALLLGNDSAAEEVVQDAFVALHRRWHKLRDPARATAYLRASVVNGTRSIHRRRAVAIRHPEDRPFDVPSAEQHAILDAASAALVDALSELPRRQCEALVLRYYGGLSEAEIAAAMKISQGAVKSHASRGMAGLRTALDAWS